jgi:hypothetical protein
LKEEILSTIAYFNFFNYPPTIEEIYFFLKKRTTKKKVTENLIELLQRKKIEKIRDFNNIIRFKLGFSYKYTIEEYGIKSINKNKRLKIKTYNERYFFSRKKLLNWRFRFYIKLLSFVPHIKLVGLSGSLSMMNASLEDDIDLFIITEKNRLFTGRFVAIILAKILGIHRSYNKRYKLNVACYSDKVCLNLFFDESDLAVPDFKRNEYVAHEILQMKPIVNKDSVYERFLAANSWVFGIFPNAKEVVSIKYKVLSIKKKKSLNTCYLILNTFFNKIEQSLKVFQLHLINRHRTTEIITSTQLWFHPNDFYKRIHELTKKKDELTRIKTDKKRKNKASQKI